MNRVQLVNLTLLLMTIRDGVLQDRLAACFKFAIDAAQADRIGALSVQQMVTNFGDANLFPARRNLLALLEAPLPRARPLAAVHAARNLAC